MKIINLIKIVCLITLTLTACGKKTEEASTTADSSVDSVSPTIPAVPAVASPIVLSLLPSRISGTAPLSVNFDATGTVTSSSITTNPYHDIEYRWNFGDALGSPVNGSSWSNGVGNGTNSRNSATGPTTGHIFERPGTYVVTLTAFDGTNTNSTTTTITVADPDVTFSGANTVCIANTTAIAGVNGCPAGATTPAGTSSFNTALSSCIGTLKRCLFKRGDTFVSSATTSIRNAGPSTIGSYGSGAAPLITSTNVVGVLTLGDGADDLRIMDLNIKGSGTSDIGYGSFIWGNLTNITFLRNTISDIGSGIIIGSGSGIDKSLIQENHIYNISKASGGVGIFGQASNSAYIGNFIGPFAAASEHLIRLQPGYKVSISNNTLTTPGASGKQVLTIRALEHTPDAIDPTVYPWVDTQYIYISDNKMIAGNSSIEMFQVAPASIGQNNWISDVISERNYMQFGPVTQTGYYSQGVRLTVRNNICNASGGATYRTCFANSPYNTAGAPAPDNNKYYSNTCYSADSSPNTGGSSFQCIMLDGSSMPITNSVVKNNLAYAPTGNSPRLLLTASASNVTGTIGSSGTEGNSSNTDVSSTNPNFLNTSGQFNAASDFKPAASSYAVGSAVSDSTVPSWSDFFLNVRLPSSDSGAILH